MVLHLVQLYIEYDNNIMINFWNHQSLIEGDYNIKDIKVKDEIGRGNSHVYTATINNSTYALKQIQIKSDYQYQSFHKEITSMKQISQLSTDMIRYYGYFVTQSQTNQYTRRKYAYIIMQCAEMNLQQLICLTQKQNRKYTKHELLKIIQFLLGAFYNLQKNKISHCDIKPENILVLNRDLFEFKLCDVGSCKIIDGDSVEEATVFGTVPFLAPELVKTKSSKIISTNVFKSDVFSFGLVVLYLITFKKFTSKERIEIPQRAYFQVIAQWIKQARQLVGYDSRITEVLRNSLQISQTKRPLFREVKQIYEQQKKKKIIAQQAKIKKLQDQQYNKSKKMQQNFLSIPTSNTSNTTKINLFGGGGNYKTRNFGNTTTSKISTRTTSVGLGFPKISRNYERDRNTSPGQLSPGLSPLLSKRQSSCFGSPQKINASILDYKKIIYLTQQQKQLITFQSLCQQQKIFTLLCTSLPTSIHKAQILSIYQPCPLSVLYDMEEFQANRLYLEYGGFEGIAPGADCPVLRRVRKIYANFWKAELVGGYRTLFRAFCGEDLEVLEIVITGADIQVEDVEELLDRLVGKNMKYLGIIWQSYIMKPQQHTKLTQKLSKLSVKKLTLVLNQNFIKYQKQCRFALPKNLQTLYLSYKTNFMQKQISNLSITLQKYPLKQLYINLSSNNLSKSQLNMLFKSISTLSCLQKFICNFSWNVIEDISYVISSLSMFKSLITFQIVLYQTAIPKEQVFELLKEAVTLFQGSLKMFKIFVDRDLIKEQFYDVLNQAGENMKGLKIDVVGFDNKYLMGVIKKSSKTMAKTKAATGKIKPEKSNLLSYKPIQAPSQQKKQGKSGQCQSLYTSTLSFDNYLCLTCSEFSELSKYEHFCKYCIQSCKHKGHNFIKIYERTKCCCAYSGHCNTDIVKRVCAEELKVLSKKEWDCLKCQRMYCQGCVTRCLELHKPWVEESKDNIVFVCKSPL